MTRYPTTGDVDEPDDELRAEEGPDGEHLLDLREMQRDFDTERFNTPAKGEKWCPADFMYG